MPALPDVGRTVAEARKQAAQRLASASDSPDLDAELLLRAVLGVDRTALFLRSEEVLCQQDSDRFDEVIKRRIAGEPVAYILHRKAFRNITLYVDERVLVPRSGTEMLVQHALDWIRSRPRPLKVIDIGTGSGAIALALASELSDRADVEIVASDVSSDALQVAATNRERLGLTGRVRLVRTHLLDGLDERFDVILANLPYLKPRQRHPSILHEPQVALYSGQDGFDLYRELIPALPAALAKGGLVIAEIDPSQAELAEDLVRGAAPFSTSFLKDLEGHVRFLIAESNPES
jgi:release factor glutamine methyltransferase